MEASSTTRAVSLHTEYVKTVLVNVTAQIKVQNNGGANVFELVLQVLNIFIGILGLLGNTFVIIVIVGFTKMHKQLTNMYVVNQCIIDAVSSLFLIAQISSQNVKVTLTAHQPLSEIYCRIWYTRSLLWACYMSSTYNIVVLTIERYLKIVHPVLHKVSFTLRKAKALLAFVWLFGISYQIFYLMPTAAIPKTSCKPLVAWPNNFTRDLVSYITLTVQYWLPVLIFIISYWKMINSLRRVAAIKTEGISSQFFYLNL